MVLLFRLDSNISAERRLTRIRQYRPADCRNMPTAAGFSHLMDTGRDPCRILCADA